MENTVVKPQKSNCKSEATENVGVENAITAKVQGWQMHE